MAAQPAVVAVLDACVLYPPSLRDFLLWLAAGFVYDLRLTDAIHDEWVRNALENHPHLTAGRLARTRALMNALSPETLVTGYEGRIDGLRLPDPDDRHVLAAAIHARASVVVTFNLRDFPETALAAFGIAACHPDAFVVGLLDRAGTGSQVVAMTRRARLNLKNPPKTQAEYLEMLDRNRMPKTAARLAKHVADL